MSDILESPCLKTILLCHFDLRISNTRRRFGLESECGFCVFVGFILNQSASKEDRRHISLTDWRGVYPDERLTPLQHVKSPLEKIIPRSVRVQSFDAD